MIVTVRSQTIDRTGGKITMRQICDCYDIVIENKITGFHADMLKTHDAKLANRAYQAILNANQE